MSRALRLLPCAVATGALALAAPAGAAPFFDVGKLPAPPVSGKEIADNVAKFSTTYKNRVTASPNETAATEALRKEAEGLGYETTVVSLPARAGTPATGMLKAVVAVKRGRTKPNEHIVFGGHYDNVPQTVDGAYDNGTGTMMLQALAKSFANVPTNRTLVFAWYNGEEEGTLASQPHAQSFKDGAKAVRAMLGFDMVGIGWPVASTGPKNCLCMWRGDGDEAFEGLLKHINYTVLGFPGGPNQVEVRGLNSRNSDEASWDKIGFPTLRWAGMRTAGDYPEYHKPGDTMATIDTVAGGRMFFEMGLRNTLLSSYLTALALDNEQPVAKASASGTGPITFDAAGSSDPDGAPSSITWDFGDGKTATGSRVTHSYAKPGDYVAKVTVADSLWPQVTSTDTVAVKIPEPPAAAPPAAAPIGLAPALPAATPKAARKATKKKKARTCRTVKPKSKKARKGKSTRKARASAKPKKAKAKAKRCKSTKKRRASSRKRRSR